MNIKYRNVLAVLNDFTARELGTKRTRRSPKVKHHPLPPKLARIRAIQKEMKCSLNEALKAYEIESVCSQKTT